MALDDEYMFQVEGEDASDTEAPQSEPEDEAVGCEDSE